MGYQGFGSSDFNNSATNAEPATRVEYQTSRNTKPKLTKKEQEALNEQVIELAKDTKAGNRICADCKKNSTTWLSKNIGVFLCINCAGVHRQIGTHISFVRSITLDNHDQKSLDFLRTKGNKAVNAEL